MAQIKFHRENYDGCLNNLDKIESGPGFKPGQYVLKAKASELAFGRGASAKYVNAIADETVVLKIQKL